MDSSFSPPSFISLKCTLEVTSTTALNIRTTNVLEHRFDGPLEALGMSGRWQQTALQGAGAPGGERLRAAPAAPALAITWGLSSTMYEISSFIWSFAGKQREQSHRRPSQCCTQPMCDMVKI